MTKKFVLVAGNIGAGKTSLTTRLGERLGWETGYESVQDNPFLADFYGDMARWSFHLQVFFLGHRAQQHQALYAHGDSAISDRSIYEDAHIFARVLHHLGNMSDRDYAAYKTAYELVIAGLPRPDLLLYLECPVDILIKRIQERGREMETGISAEYLATLDRFYKDWIRDFDLCPVVTIPSSDLNFVQRDDHLEIVIEHIESRLAGRDNVVFPAA
ncbi:MAG: deoxyadenosine/deoxycytidine kinase [Cellvibrionaceae bacterium]|jgi:deoxyadenosine/deoxycytidine kinase